MMALANLVPGLGAPADYARRRDQNEERLKATIRFAFFLMMALGVTLFQKIGFGPGADSIVPLIIPLMFVGLGAMAFAAEPVINPIRLGLYLLFVILSVLSTGLFASQYSFSSIALFIVLYMPMIVSFKISEEEYRKYFNLFSSMMVGFAGLEFAQHLIQLLLSWQWWPDLNRLLPEQLLIPFYNYIQPVAWGLPYMKPNAVFFLEVSFLSQFLALALAGEIVLFRRPWRIALFTAALFATFAGTGLLLMIMTLPVLLGRLKIRTMTLVLLGMGIVGALAYWLGWFGLIQDRLDEFSKAGQSGNMRFVLPFERMVEFIDAPGSLYSGIGAGQIEKGENFQFWPITKAVLEYGYLPGIAFYAFFLYAIFDNPVSKRIAFTLAVWFTFEGALLTAVNPFTCALLSSLFVPLRPQRLLLGSASPRPAPEQSERTPADNPAPAEAPKRHQRSTRIDLSVRAQSTLPDGSVDLAACCGRPDTDGRRIYVVGDIHGRADLLRTLLEQIFREAASTPVANGTKPMIVFLGDYIDRGKSSRLVIEYMVRLKQSPYFDARFLIGNHEEAMLDFIERRSIGAVWNKYGGLATLKSYGVVAPENADDRDGWNAARDALLATMPAEHIEFLRSLEDMAIIGDLLCVHAGLRPGVPLAEQKKRDLLYIRSDFFEAPVDCGKIIVHGHSPGEQAYGAPGRLCLDSCAYASGLLTAAKFEPFTVPELIEVRVS